MIFLNKELEKMRSSNEAVSEGKILCNLPHELHNEWDNFMRGKTCPVLDNGDYGVYSWDLNQFLSKI